MAWTTPADWTNAEVVTNTKLNTHVRDNMRELWHEVAYTEFAAAVSSSNSTLIDVVSAGAVTFLGYPIFIEFYAPGVKVALGGSCLLVLDGAALSNIMWPDHEGTGGKMRTTPSAASHTYKIQLCGSGGGLTTTATAAAGSPGFIRILEQGGA